MSVSLFKPSYVSDSLVFYEQIPLSLSKNKRFEPKICCFHHDFCCFPLFIPFYPLLSPFVTKSESLLSLFTFVTFFKRATGANHSHNSSKRAIRSLKRVNCYFALSLTKYERFVRKTKRLIPSPDLTPPPFPSILFRSHLGKLNI